MPRRVALVRGAWHLKRSLQSPLRRFVIESETPGQILRWARCYHQTEVHISDNPGRLVRIQLYYYFLYRADYGHSYLIQLLTPD